MIRLATPSDVPFLPAIERSAGDAFRQIADLEWIADDDVQSEARHLELVEGGAAWVAVDAEDRPVGFLSGEVAGGELHIWELAVRAADQGRGLGGALIEAAIEWAAFRDFDAVTLTTFLDVRWNERFYQSLGFRTLSDDELSSRLRHVLADEVKAGLPGQRRCAMILPVRKPS